MATIDHLEASEIEVRWRIWWRRAEAAFGHRLDDGGDFDGFGVEEASDSFRRGETPATYVAAVQASDAYKTFGQQDRTQIFERGNEL